MNRKKYAYVTFVMRNDSFAAGALVLAYRLLKMCTEADLVCLVTKDVSEHARMALQTVYDHVILIDEIRVEHSRYHERQDRPYLFTRFQALRLGRDGDLGCSYDKIVMLDADVMPLKRYDELFEVKAPAGIINERKAHWVSKKPRLSDDGKSVWHDIYEAACPHGAKIPLEWTDRVWHDSTNMGVNACLWVLEPSMEDYRRIRNIVLCPNIIRKISSFNWPEMQFATAYFSGRWHNVDIRYCAYNGHPSLDQVYGTHFAGLKPWNDKKRKALSHYLTHKDYQMWYEEFREMVAWVYPSLGDLPKFRRLLSFYQKYQGVVR